MPSDRPLYRLTMADFEIALRHHAPVCCDDPAFAADVLDNVQNQLDFVEWAEDFDRMVRDAVEDVTPAEEGGDNPPAR